MTEIDVKKDISGNLIVTFPYDRSLVAKVKTIEGYKWHPDKKHWSFPNVDGTLDRILKVFESERIHLDPTLQVNLPFLFGQVHKSVQTVKESLAEHLKRVRQLHQRDLQEGYGRVYMPYALERKYPNAGK